MNRNEEMYGGPQKRKFAAEAITAEQARAKAATAAKIKAETELTQVFNLIDEACHKGLFSVDYIGNLSDGALKRLLELGYEYMKIGPAHPMDEEFAQTGIRISWAEKNEK